MPRQIMTDISTANEQVLPRHRLCLALELTNDQNHAAVLAHWRQLVGSAPSLVITSFVLDEIATFLNTRGFHEKAVEVGERILQSSAVEFIHVDAELFAAAWQYFAGHKDKRYSLTDCVSFVVTERGHMVKALATDRHFAQAGFQTEP
jgi:uncharacterized protein